MGALNTAAKLINGLLASAESNGSSSRKSEPTTKASAAPAAAQQLVADAQKAGQGLSKQAQQAAAQAKDAAAQAKGVAADSSRAAAQVVGSAQQATAGGVGDVDRIFADMQGEQRCKILFVLGAAVCAGSSRCGDSHGAAVRAKKGNCIHAGGYVASAQCSLELRTEGCSQTQHLTFSCTTHYVVFDDANCGCTPVLCCFHVTRRQG
jgi:hypothetical protein